jgi:nucleotide-binding universal stress UspA family protein
MRAIAGARIARSAPMIERVPSGRNIGIMLAEPHLLLCYDGSEHAMEAIEFAGALFPPRTRATVLYGWEPAVLAVGGGIVAAAIPPDIDERDAARAMGIAQDGAQRARSAGLAAEARTERTTASTWRTIVDVADGEYDVIVMGTRGLTGVRSLLLGSCSHQVTQHATCPVLIVPGAALGEARRGMSRPNRRAAPPGI